MRKTTTKAITTQETTHVACNMCERDITDGERDVDYVTVWWDPNRGSGVITATDYWFEICSTCLQAMTSILKIPPEENREYCG